MRNGSYVLVAAPEGYPGKRYRGRYAYEHHVVWWRATGKAVPPGHVIHHLNENKADNRVENLRLMPVGAHAAHHAAVPPLEVDCAYCGTSFRLLPSKAKTRAGRNAEGKLFCSRSCGTKGSKARQRRQAPKEIPHGTSVGYGYHRCRCTRCKAAHATRIRTYKAKRLARSTQMP